VQRGAEGADIETRTSRANWPANARSTRLSTASAARSGAGMPMDSGSIDSAGRRASHKQAGPGRVKALACSDLAARRATVR
jgi:hypothetical protein